MTAERKLTDEQILDEASHHGFLCSREMLLRYSRAIEAAAREQDEALLRQARSVLLANPVMTAGLREKRDEALAAINARLDARLGAAHE